PHLSSAAPEAADKAPPDMAGECDLPATRPEGLGRSERMLPAGASSCECWRRHLPVSIPWAIQRVPSRWQAPLGESPASTATCLWGRNAQHEHRLHRTSEL